jgi:hypothetical protein
MAKVASEEMRLHRVEGLALRSVILSDEVAVATEESKDPYCLPRLKVAIGALRLAAKAAARSG